MPVHRCGLVSNCGHHSLRSGTEAVGTDVFNSSGVGGREEGSGLTPVKLEHLGSGEEWELAKGTERLTRHYKNWPGVVMEAE